MRLFVNDDKSQAEYAVYLIKNNSIFIPKTVFLETEWVLRYTYELDAKEILEAFKKLIGLPQVTVEDSACILQALQWYENGLDFADALHLASNPGIESFATLDKDFISKAKKFDINLITQKSVKDKVVL